VPEQARGVRTRPAKVSPATYWRRRITVLAAAAVLLTGLSWAVNGLLTASSTAGQAPPSGGNRAAGSSRAHLGTDRASDTPSPSPSPSPSPTRSKHRAARRAHTTGGTPTCTRAKMTLSVSSPQYFYQPGKTPRFTARAVSQEDQSCRFNMGAKFVSLVISSGDRQLWSSADCVRGSGSHMVIMADGKPAVLRFSWDRRTSSSGCDTGHLVRPGEYQVSVIAGRLHSRSANFVLGAKGVSGP
jgi:hypothetical protein